MRIPAARPRQLAVAALALTLPLAGCSSSHDSTSSAGTTTSATPATGGSPSAAASSEPSAQASATPGLTTWPTRPTTVDESGVPKVVRFGVLSQSYTGTAFVDALTRQWHITLGARKKFDSTNDDSPAVWHAEGTEHPSGGTELGVAVVWDKSGDLKALTCTATAKAPGRAAFLRACVRLDHPGSDPAAAARWLDGVTTSVDRTYREAGLTVTSPLYRAGPAATYLREYGGGPTPTTYQLTVFGAGS